MPSAYRTVRKATLTAILQLFDSLYSRRRHSHHQRQKYFSHRQQDREAYEPLVDQQQHPIRRTRRRRLVPKMKPSTTTTTAATAPQKNKGWPEKVAIHPKRWKVDRDGRLVYVPDLSKAGGEVVRL